MKARVKAEALREFIVTRDKVIVMGHKIADPDSFGACMGIYRAAVSLEKKAHIVINEVTGSVRPLYDEILESPAYEDDIFITSEQALDYVDDNAMVIVVDTNKPQMTECPELLKRSKMIAVLDHHRQSSNIIENAVLSYVEPYSSSTCEMIAEVLQYMVDDIKFPALEAECMYAGIMIDTRNFMNRTGVRTFEAAAFLRRCGADITRYVRCSVMIWHLIRQRLRQSAMQKFIVRSMRLQYAQAILTVLQCLQHKRRMNCWILAE